jgi:radical SAM superfamily enzyme YgiQ (UPF0313 family)
LELLSKQPSPYTLEEDNEERHNRLVYFETSRGCPYRCNYCLSSLEKSVLSYQFIFDNLSFLINSDIKQIKFLYRTFNLNKKHTKELFSFLIDNYKTGLSLQFEIYADILDDETILFLNENLKQDYFRFEIG